MYCGAIYKDYTFATYSFIKAREATSPNPYLYVWLEFGGDWVIFQSRLDQEGVVVLYVIL